MEDNYRSWPLVPLVIGLLLLAAVIGFYWPVLTTWAGLVIHDDDSSYMVLLPLVSGFIIYRKWARLRELPLQPSWWGLLVVAAGLGIYIFGELFQSLFIPAFSFVVVLMGLVWLMGGPGLVRELAFPLLLLLFMIPYQGFWVRKLTLPLQLVSSRLAAGMLELSGYTLNLQGNIIDLGDRQLNVVAACSGLRYIINMWTGGAIFCYFFQRRAWKVAVIILAIIPYAIVGNALRIATIGIFPIFQDGLWHSSLGLSIILLGFDYLRLINWLLNRIERPAVRSERQAIPGKLAVMATAGMSRLTPYLIAALVIIVLAGPLALSAPNVPPRPLTAGLEKFPLTLGNWQGVIVTVDEQIIKVTTSDDHFNGRFRNPQGELVNLWIAYYQDKKRGKSFHSPAICMTGSGWRALNSKEIRLAPGLPATSMIMDQNGNRVLVYYWYRQAGRWVSGDYGNKLATLYDLLVQRRSDGALIRIDTPVGQDLDSAHDNLQQFARLLILKLKDFFPK